MQQHNNNRKTAAVVIYNIYNILYTLLPPMLENGRRQSYNDWSYYVYVGVYILNNH